MVWGPRPGALHTLIRCRGSRVPAAPGALVGWETGGNLGGGGACGGTGGSGGAATGGGWSAGGGSY